jgi:hypothetical protein
MTTPLVDIVQELKRNTFAWAKLWVLNGAPDEFYPDEHHIITAALVSFRARYRAATECAFDPPAALFHQRQLAP